MDSVLTSLGLNRAAPNPADFNAASDIGKQLTTVKGNINTTLSTIGAAITAGKAMGMNNGTINTLSSLETKTQALLTNNDMTPAALERQRAIIQAELVATQASVATTKYNELLAAVIASHMTVSTRVAQVANDTTISEPLLADYKTLLTDVSGTIDLVKATNPGTMGSTLPKTADGILYYVPPSGMTTPDDAKNRLYDLDTRYDQNQSGEFNWSRMYQKAYKFFFTTFVSVMFGILTVISILLGGIVTSNAYISEWVGNRIYYFIYGGLLFPLTIAYGIFYTPYWQAYILPITEYVATTTPLSGGSIPVTTTAHAAPVDHTSLFQYVRVGATPTDVQTSNRKMLRMLCLIDLILFTGFTAMYGYTDKILNARFWTAR